MEYNLFTKCYVICQLLFSWGDFEDDFVYCVHTILEYCSQMLAFDRFEEKNPIWGDKQDHNVQYDQKRDRKKQI